MLEILFQSLGGLGLFLFGMKIMSEGLQKVAGKKMRQTLNWVSNNRFVGCAVGTLVTSVIQSSSATTVMLVGFVDAGLMTLMQATGVILGANIGTTVTAQLIAFEIQAYALPAIAAGVFLKFFLGRRRWVYFGDVLLGFGLVFFGLATMKAGFSPLRDAPAFIAFFTKFNADGPKGILLCVFAGTIMTMILQSSSATVGITMALASQGLLGFESSVAFILGENIGTTITAQLASIGGSISARRTARAHALFNVVGVTYVIILFPFFIKLVLWITAALLNLGAPEMVIGGERPFISRYIANSHTVFNVVNALFFIIFLPQLVKVATWLTPAPKDEKTLEELHRIRYLDSRYVDTPSVALGQARAEIIRMGEAVQVMYRDVICALEERRIKELIKWRKREDALDILQREITHFLVEVAQNPISSDESKEVASILRMTNNFERIGDAIENVAELIEELIEQDLHLSEGGLKDYKDISTKVEQFIDLSVEGIRRENKNIMSQAQEFEDGINRMREEMRGNYLIRMQSGVCAVDPGLILVDMLTAFEKMGDYCYNIAQAVAGVK